MSILISRWSIHSMALVWPLASSDLCNPRSLGQLSPAAQLAKALSFESRVGAPSLWYSGFGLIYHDNSWYFPHLTHLIEPTAMPGACGWWFCPQDAGGNWDLETPFCSCERFEPQEHHGAKMITSHELSKESLEPCTPRWRNDATGEVGEFADLTDQAWGPTINGDTLPKRNEINRLETRPVWKRVPSTRTYNIKANNTYMKLATCYTAIAIAPKKHAESKGLGCLPKVHVLPWCSPACPTWHDWDVDRVQPLAHWPWAMLCHQCTRRSRESSDRIPNDRGSNPCSWFLEQNGLQIDIHPPILWYLNLWFSTQSSTTPCSSRLVNCCLGRVSRISLVYASPAMKGAKISSIDG